MTHGFRHHRYWLAAAVLPVIFPLAGQAASPIAKNMACATCHRAEAASQPKTAMGIGIELPPNQEVLQKHPKLTADENGYHYEIEYKDGAGTYTVSDPSGKLTLPIKYAFGFYNVTFVFEYQGDFYESMVSYYENIGGLATTIGDNRLQPHNLVEAMGRKTSENEITACFGCHSTGAVSQRKLTLTSLQPGVSCEHCHEGATAHMQALAAGKTAPLPRHLGDMGAEEMSNFCGQCHRTWENVVEQGIFGQRNVRFQPYRLANSKCFLGDDKRIRCTACHNPHQEIVRAPAAYDKACLACHGTSAIAAADAVTKKSCPVSDKNCVTCHMPKVTMPGSPSVFSDHQIRVVRVGEKYPN